jgi:PRC-barrel domain
VTTGDPGTPVLHSVIDPKAGPRWGGHVPTPPTPDPPTPPDDPAPPPSPDEGWPVPVDRLIGCRVEVDDREAGWVSAIVFNPRMTDVVGVDVTFEGHTSFVPWVYLSVQTGWLVATIPGEEGFVGLAAVLQHGARIRRSGAETSNLRIERDGRVCETANARGGASVHADIAGICG